VKQPRILIVDDNDMNVQLAAFILSEADCEVESAADAGQGMLQIASFRPDLILMDIQMPDMDGLELTRRLKAEPATRHIVVVAFTAYAMMGDEAKLLTEGCDGYIAKPIDITKFAEKVCSYLPREARDDSMSVDAHDIDPLS
jgi:CheY-like chemotaxis protein